MIRLNCHLSLNSSADASTPKATSELKATLMVLHPEDDRTPYGADANFAENKIYSMRDHGATTPLQSLQGAGGTKNSEQLSFLYILPKEGPKALDPLQPAGAAHRAQFWGVSLVSQMLEARSAFLNRTICVELSAKVLSVLVGDETDFLLGCLQRPWLSRAIAAGSSSGPSSGLSEGAAPTTPVEVTPGAPQNKPLVAYLPNAFSDDLWQRARALSDAMVVTRQLIQTPPNVLNTTAYVEEIKTLCQGWSSKTNGTLNVEVWDAARLQQERCGLLYAVGQGSATPPYLVKLSYTPPGSTILPLISLVGKGITFDTGGYDLKPSSGMRLMKKDMGGSAAVLGTFLACSALKLPVRLHCFLAIAENMVSNNAMRPGDVYTSRNGISVEIDNTDAEGRLVLADALCVAAEEQPQAIIDVATLTGAARTALGPMVDAFYTNDAHLQDLFQSSSCQTGDWVWPMPLPASYDSYLESMVASCVNSSPSPFAGSVTAALFLKKFVGTTPWAHLDSYMWCDKPFGPWGEGSAPTGKCVRLLVQVISCLEK